MNWDRAKPWKPTEQAFPSDSLAKRAQQAEREWLNKQVRYLEKKPARPGAMTEAQIEAGRSPKGGWTRETLAGWGVPWPPPKGWRRALVRGLPVPGGHRVQPHYVPRPVSAAARAKAKLAVLESGNPETIRAVLNGERAPWE